MSNVASRTYKKESCSFGLQFAPRTGFEMHLVLPLGVDPAKPRLLTQKSENGDTARPGQLKMLWVTKGAAVCCVVVAWVVLVCACVCVCSMWFLLWLTASGRAPPGRQGSADFLHFLHLYLQESMCAHSHGH